MLGKYIFYTPTIFEIKLTETYPKDVVRTC